MLVFSFTYSGNGALIQSSLMLWSTQVRNLNRKQPGPSKCSLRWTSMDSLVCNPSLCLWISEKRKLLQRRVFLRKRCILCGNCGYTTALSAALIFTGILTSCAWTAPEWYCGGGQRTTIIFMQTGWSCRLIASTSAPRDLLWTQLRTFGWWSSRQCYSSFYQFMGWLC